MRYVLASSFYRQRNWGEQVPILSNDKSLQLWSSVLLRSSKYKNSDLCSGGGGRRNALWQEVVQKRKRWYVTDRIRKNTWRSRLECSREKQGYSSRGQRRLHMEATAINVSAGDDVGACHLVYLAWDILTGKKRQKGQIMRVLGRSHGGPGAKRRWGTLDRV